MMLFGQFTQNLSGAFNYTTTIFYEFQSLTSGSEDSLIGKMNDAIVAYYADYDEASEYIGYEIGQIMSGVFEFSIPVYIVNEYEF